MITFSSPITVHRPTPTPVTPPAITLSTLEYSVTYDDDAQIATAFLKNGINRKMTLWTGADYVAQGQFTDEMTDAQVTALLGADPASVINALFTGVQPYVQPSS